MTAPTADTKLPQSYFKLVRRFPLIHIRDDAHLDSAQAILDELLQQELDAGAQEYLDVLTHLVEIYENAHHALPDASEADVLRELMRANNLTESDLAPRVRVAEATLAAVLRGEKHFTQNQASALGSYFGVAPAAFRRN